MEIIAHVKQYPMQMLIAVGIGMLTAFLLLRRSLRRQMLPPAGKAVLITGADTGFGKDAVFRFRQLGYPVVAACLDAKKAMEETYAGLKDPKNFLVVQMDVTHQSEIEAAKFEVEKWLALDSSYRLYGVINNAGIGGLCPIEWLPLEDAERIMNINFMGALRVSKAFLPLLRKNNGQSTIEDSRLVVVASMAGEAPLMGGNLYCCSKTAVLRLFDIFRMELQPFNIKVVQICPDFYGTPLVANIESIHAALDSRLAKCDDEVLSAYGGSARVALMKANLENIAMTTKTDITPVIDCYVASIASPNPSACYRPIEFKTAVIKFVYDWAPGFFEWIQIYALRRNLKR